MFLSISWFSIRFWSEMSLIKAKVPSASPCLLKSLPRFTMTGTLDPSFLMNSFSNVCGLPVARSSFMISTCIFRYRGEVKS